ncbi:hypothetical protein FA95DRAFT_1640562 [Auriscalpium vulgare]|uniref:Uncharacterized protein n=1 Tax=Auriscalpium vulgare TaxID=40419 RepID=A0ACB8S1F6_9AGAM|nr:hypothetical protein FA95DRAFT_1640562 [Auriscalpium vulgare]
MSDKIGVPLPVATRRQNPRRRLHPIALWTLAACLTFVASSAYLSSASSDGRARATHVPWNAQDILARCATLSMVPGPPADFHARDVSDRYEEGIPSTLIKNATIWTGRENGTEILFGDVLLEKGLVKGVGYVPRTLTEGLKELTVVDAEGAWVTPGLIDFHSHIGIYSLPTLRGTFNLNSHKGPILPWLRSIDAFDTHDDSIQLAIAGGVTSIQILPGSANAIAGQAFMLKLRTTSEHSPSSMIIEPPYSLNGTVVDPFAPPRWRHLKQAAGENIDAYGTRMDSHWAYRQAYDEARQLKTAQDAYCANAQAGLWDRVMGDFPEDFRWEALVDVLRGRVKVSQHIYEAVDIDAIVRLSNEFQFRVDSFHHAAEAYLVPELLNKTWGGTPAIALFADNYRYKRESYRGSVHAPRILSDNGFPVIMKTDHPAENGRFLLYEAQQAYYYGLPAPLALASLTTTPARAAGLDHRIGFLHEGADADVVLWDSHPLLIGATPVRVWIDGAPQAVGPERGVVVGRGKEAPEWRELPDVPDWRKERKKVLEYEGLPPLKVENVAGRVVFANVSEVMVSGEEGIQKTFSGATEGNGIVVVEDGKLVCAGIARTCSSFAPYDHARMVDLRGGALAPALIAFGSPLGLEEISYESSTGDGPLYNAFVKDVPVIIGDTGGIVQAADGLQFQTRNALLAHRYGITVGTSYSHTLFASDVISGLSTTFRTGAPHALADGAIIQRVSALHYSVRRPPALDLTQSGNSAPSVSTRIAVLRRLLLEGDEGSKSATVMWFGRAADGRVPLVLDVGSADAMAVLLELKKEVEEKRGTTIRMVFTGAAEAHILAKEIGEAHVGVILTPSRPKPETWDDRRLLPGPPLSNETAITTLLANNVLLGIGTPDAAFAHQIRFDLAWAAADAGGRLSPDQALELASVNLERLLGIDRALDGQRDIVAYEGGGPLDLSSKVVGVVSIGRGVVDIL